VGSRKREGGGGSLKGKKEGKMGGEAGIERGKGEEEWWGGVRKMVEEGEEG